MPSRILRESIRTSPTVAQVSRGAECLFYRVMVTADDYGRFKADARILKGACFPICDDVTVEQIEGWLNELVSVGLLVLYSTDGQRFGFLKTWFSYQRQPRSKTSKFPAPPEMLLSTAGQVQTSADNCEQML